MTPLTHTHQKGIAVVTAMLLAALTAVIVGQLVWQQQLLISELQNQLNATQANLFADAAIEWSRSILTEDANSTEVDHYGEIWATRLPATPIEGGVGTLKGQIIDMQQFLNLNNLVDEYAARVAYERLLNTLNLSKKLVSPLIDWTDTDDITNDADGAESMYYRSLDAPYLAANQMLTEMGNLIRVKGYDKTTIEKITPFTTVLPKRTSVNVNTASAEVLSFLIPETSLQDAQTLVASRNIAYFKDMDDFKNRLPNKSVDIGNINLSVNSLYFLVVCNIKVDRSELKMQALLYREQNKWPVILWKRIG